MTQRHAVWVVPNYDGRATEGGSRNSHPVTYLRLGSTTNTVAELSTPALRGDDLLTLAGIPTTPTTFFFDDTNGGVDRNQSGAATTYKRYDGRTPSDAGTPSDVATLTGELRSRGGWRDHTDGNRISTTRGDRYDFVQGNYKRVIFGRVHESVAGFLSRSTWESSGGHNHDTTSTPGEVTSISWVATQGGTWQVIELTEKGNTLTRFSGKHEEHFDGDHLETTIGKSGGTGRVNPVMEETTYATTITTSTNAASIDTTETIENGYRSYSKVKGSATEYVYANKIEDYTCEIGKEAVVFREHLVADKIENVTKFGTRTNISISATTISIDLIGNATEQVGLPFIDPPATPPPLYARLAFWLGPQLNIDVGVSASMWLGGKAMVNVGNKIELGLSASLELHFVAVLNKLKAQKAGLSETKAELANINMNTSNNKLAALKKYGA